MSGARPAPTPADLAIIDPDGSFRMRLEHDLLTLEAVYRTGDFSSVPALVHRLAGAAGTFGYEELGDVAIGLDDAYREGKAAELGDLDSLADVLRRSLATS